MTPRAYVGPLIYVSSNNSVNGLLDLSNCRELPGGRLAMESGTGSGVANAILLLKSKPTSHVVFAIAL